MTMDTKDWQIPVMWIGIPMRIDLAVCIGNADSHPNPGARKFTSVADPGLNPDPSNPYAFGASWIRIRIHQSEVWIRILLSSFKNSKQNLDSYCFVTLFDFLTVKNDVNLPSKSRYNQKNIFLNQFLVGILMVNSRKSRIRIRIRIHQSEAQICGYGSGSTPKCHGSATLKFI